MIISKCVSEEPLNAMFLDRHDGFLRMASGADSVLWQLYVHMFDSMRQGVS